MEVPVIMVGTDSTEVERRLSTGGLVCPCGGDLARWGFVRPRTVRGAGFLEHSETGQTPWDRWSVITPTLPTPGQLREAFLWSEWRTVTKTATVGLHGNNDEVDGALIGRKVELGFDPFDLTTTEVRWQHRPMGHAVPHKIGRHVHHKVRPDDTTPPPAPTGIDYLRLVEQQHTHELAERLRYSTLPDQPVAGRLPDRPLPGQSLLSGINDNQTSDEVPA